MPEDPADQPPGEDSPFFGFLTLRCAAPDCECLVQALVGGHTLYHAWTRMRGICTQYGWVTDPHATNERGVDFCACDHPEKLMPR